jgi:hypothetical protein
MVTALRWSLILMQARDLCRASWASPRSIVARATVIDPDQHGLERVVVKRDADHGVVSSNVGCCAHAIVVIRCDQTPKEIIMALADLQRAINYGESELGEVAILKPSDGTYQINNARNGATVLAAGTSAATVKARVAVIHPSINKITT